MTFVPTHLSESTKRFLHSIVPYEDTPRPGDWAGAEIARVDWAFTVREGKWDVTAELGSIDTESRARWLKPVADPEWCEHGGGAHQFTTALIGLDGKLVHDKTFLYWSAGYEKIGLPPAEFNKVLETDGHIVKSGGRGWATHELYESDSHDYKIGVAGPWCACPLAPADIYRGVGMPWFKEHISTVVVWKMTPRGSTPGELPTDPATVSAVLARLAGIDASLAQIAAQFERFNTVVLRGLDGQ